MSKTKHTVIMIIRIAGFLAAFSLVWAMLTFILTPKNNTASSGIINPSARGFYSEPKNSIDMFVIGNSDAYSGFSPIELWNAYGYTSYVCGEGKQSVADAVNLLREILTCHTPKVVILETDELFYDGNKSSSHVGEAVTSLANGILPLLKYHDNWKDVRLSTMFSRPKYTWHCESKGQMWSCEVQPFKYPNRDYMAPTEEIAQMPAATEKVLDEFLGICEKNGIQVIFMEIPSASSWNYAKHNGMSAYAEEKNIPFLDLDICHEAYGLDWDADSRDGGNHLNCDGARKVTLYVGQYLKTHYELNDHRDDMDYDLWNQDYEKYSSKLASKSM